MIVITETWITENDNHNNFPSKVIDLRNLVLEKRSLIGVAFYSKLSLACAQVPIKTGSECFVYDVEIRLESLTVWTLYCIKNSV